MKTVAYFIKNLLANVKRTVKIAWFKAKWKKANSHNYTTASNIFPIEKVKVGKNTYGPICVYAYGAKGERLTIGSYCSIAADVRFLLSGEHNYKRFSSFPFPAYYEKKERDAFAKGEIVVEDDVWIGFGTTILSGVRIGKGAVIAAGSLISKDVPPYAIVAGNNKIVKYRFSEEIIQKLKDIPLDKINPNYVRNQDCCMQEVTQENIDQIIEALEISMGK